MGGFADGPCFPFRGVVEGCYMAIAFVRIHVVEAYDRIPIGSDGTPIEFRSSSHRIPIEFPQDPIGFPQHSDWILIGFLEDPIGFP